METSPQPPQLNQPLQGLPKPGARDSKRLAVALLLSVCVIGGVVLANSAFARKRRYIDLECPGTPPPPTKVEIVREAWALFLKGHRVEARDKLKQLNDEPQTEELKKRVGGPFNSTYQ
jgi:hypothetical protein